MSPQAVAESAGISAPPSGDGASSVSSESLKELRRKDAAKAKRVLKLLRRKKQKQQRKTQTEENSSQLQKQELLEAVPLESKQRELLIPLGRNKKLKKKLATALNVNPQEQETDSEGSSSGDEQETLETDSDSVLDKTANLRNEEVMYSAPSEAEGAEGAVAELAAAFEDVFAKFKLQQSQEQQQEAEEADEEEGEEPSGFAEGESSEEDEGPEDKTSRKKKGSNIPTVCELKQASARPDRIEVWDCCSKDPFFLAFLKGLRNVVEVPQHWQHKRKYLQWKRGFEKPPFKLPPHIEATKISEVRSALVEAEAQKTMRQRMREKVRPKANRLAIDYQVLHDCFFKHAVKPPLTRMGDLYFEGKEFLMKKNKFKPGELSARLKDALGMGPLAPPPWLLNMQRYGPPPAYPRLVIPGVNAAIPAGAAYGYQPGGWGRPPCDEHGNLLFQADPRQQLLSEQQRQQQQERGTDPEAAFAAELWGELPPDQEVPEEEEEEETQEGEAPPNADTPSVAEGSASVSGIGSSITPSFDLAQRRGAGSTAGWGSSSVASSSAGASRPYTVLPQQPAGPQSGLFGVSHIYQIHPQQQQSRSGMQTPVGGVASSLLSASGTPASMVGPGTGAVTPGGVLSSSVLGGASTPLLGGTASASGGGTSVQSAGILTPLGTASVSGAGGASPFVAGGIASVSHPVSGVNTPMLATGGRTGGAGADTPLGVTVSLNPNEMEQEGALTAEVIRQQLKQHEEAAARAKAAAGQIDPEQKKRRGDELRGVSAAPSKTKKKKQFKF